MEAPSAAADARNGSPSARSPKFRVAAARTTWVARTMAVSVTAWIPLPHRNSACGTSRTYAADAYYAWTWPKQPQDRSRPVVRHAAAGVAA